MSPGGLFAETGSDGGDGPSHAWLPTPRGSAHSLGLAPSLTVRRGAVYGRGPDSVVLCSATLRVRGVNDPADADTREPSSPARPRARPRPRPGPAGPADRPRMEGPAAAMGPLVPPDVLVSRELSGGPRPCVHRAL